MWVWMSMWAWQVPLMYTYIHQISMSQLTVVMHHTVSCFYDIVCIAYHIIVAQDGYFIECLKMCTVLHIPCTNNIIIHCHTLEFLVKYVLVQQRTLPDIYTCIVYKLNCRHPWLSVCTLYTFRHVQQRTLHDTGSTVDIPGCLCILCMYQDIAYSQ